MDPFWNHVVKKNDGSISCVFCGEPYAKKTGITRMKWHLSGKKGHGVAICTGQVPEDIQDAAFAAAMSAGNKRQKTMANPSNVNDNAISTSPRDDLARDDVDNLTKDVGRIQMEGQRTEKAVREGRTSSRAEAGNHMDVNRSIIAEAIIGDARETRGEASQAPDLVDKHQGVGVDFSPPTFEMLSNMFPGEMERSEIDRDHIFSMDEAPESGQRTEQVDQVVEQSNSVYILAEDGGRIPMEGQDMEQGRDEERSSSHLEAANDMENTSEGNHMEIITGEMMHRRVAPDGLIVATQETREDTFQAVDAGTGEERTTSYTEVGNDIENMAALRAQEERVPGCLMRESELRTEQGGHINGVGTLAGDGGRIQMEFQGTEPGAREGRTYSYIEAGNQMESRAGEMIHIDEIITPAGPLAHAHGVRANAQPPIDERTCGNNLARVASRAEVGSQRENLRGEMMHIGKSITAETRGEASQATHLVGQATGRLVQPVAGTSSSGGRTHNTSESRGDALPTGSTKIVGGAFEENKKAILSWLNDDEVSRIGIYGMGGVGKTTLMRQIYDQIRGILHVYWITVSQDFSIYRLQHRIAKCIGLDLSYEDDEMQRVFKLLEALKRKQRCVLIFDDLWDQFCLEEEVGIPAGENGCKLILTTRSLKVCHWMGCEKKIDVQCLSEEEAWSLFTGKLGHDMAHYQEVEPIAKRVAMECDGLPLGIITMAGSMRGVHDPHEWRNTLKRLRESNHRDMENKVFRLLRFSYDRLDDLALKRCLLYCALFPEDHHIEREELIGYLIDEGIIKRMNCRQEEFDEGHTMLTRLENVCLLESCETLDGSARAVKMHDLIRDMAIQIQHENSGVMVKAGAQLKEMPDEEEWTENVVTVSLMTNQIEEIPFDYSPKCPRLSTLLLSNNCGLQFIGISFFKHLNGLKILDLSNTYIERLPDSVSDLESLVSLLLLDCMKLRHVPSLKKLRALKRLDLKGTKLHMIPGGMEELSNLRYLRLSLCAGSQMEFPSGILSKLTHLQVFVANVMPNLPIIVNAKEVACLRKMESLKCSFESYFDFLEYLKYRDQTQSLRTYLIFVGWVQYPVEFDIYSTERRKIVALGDLSINRDGDFQVTFPNDIEELIMCNCNGARSLCDVASLKDATKLKLISITDCSSMESLVSSSWLCSAPELTLQSYNGIFSGLKQLNCCGCNSMKKLFPLVLLRNLKNLKAIRVWNCEKMEEIIGTRDEEGVMGEASSSSSSNAITEVNLPKLRFFILNNLPELQSICSAKLICPSIKLIEVRQCKKLKRMPFSLPLLENGQPCPPPSLNNMIMYPEEWRERVVEWDHPNAKDVLRPFFNFPYN